MKYAKAAISILTSSVYSGWCLQLLSAQDQQMDVCTAASAQQKCINKKNPTITQCVHTVSEIFTVANSCYCLVIKIQVLPSSRATAIVQALETQGPKYKNLTKPLVCPCVFNSKVTTLGAVGPNLPPEFLSDVHPKKQPLGLQRPFLYPDYWTDTLYELIHPLRGGSGNPCT